LRARARRLGEGEAALLRHRGAMRPLHVEHAAFALLLLSGLLLMQSYGWGPARARWLGAKLGLVAFLFVPLQGMHAFIAHAWIRPGLRRSGATFAKPFVRGLGVEEMIRTLELVLGVPAVLLLVWLSVAKPF
jgi:hypothetical protein